MITETHRLRIRKLGIDDAPFIHELVNDAAFTANIGDKGIRSIDDALRFIESGYWTNQSKRGHGQFAIELKEASATVGVCGILFRESHGISDLGLALLPRYRGQGIAKEAAGAMLEYAKSVLGLTRVHALTAEHNQTSINLVARFGFEYHETIKMAEDDPGTLVYRINLTKQRG